MGTTAVMSTETMSNNPSTSTTTTFCTDTGATCSGDSSKALDSGGPAPFLTLLESQMKNNPYAGFVTMATIENNRPRARTVLFQGLAKRKDGSVGVCVKMSNESRKVKRADSCFVEIVWWMEQTSVQFRFSGVIDYDDDEQRLRVWRSLNQAAKSMFFYDATAGLDDSTRGKHFAHERQQARTHGLDTPPPSFVVGVLVPTEVDYLDLSTLKRTSWLLENGAWSEKSGFAPPVVSTRM